MPIFRFYMINGKDARGVEGDKCYIGCTQAPLHKRFYEHKKHKHTTSQMVFNEYGVENCSIRLLRLMECEPEVAVQEERRLIEEHQGRVVNARLPGRTAHERYIEKREELLPLLKEYYKANRERVKGRCLAYYHQNKAKVLEHVKRVVQCPACQKSMKYCSLSIHRKKHCEATHASHTTSTPQTPSAPSPPLSPLIPSEQE